MSNRDGGRTEGGDRERARKGHKKSSTRQSRRKSPEDRHTYASGANNLSETSEAVRHAQPGGDIFERGYDDEPVDTRTVSPRPLKSKTSPLLLRRKSRDDLIIATSNKKDTTDLQFATTKPKRDLSLDRIRSPRALLKKKNTYTVPVEVSPPTPVREPSKTIESDQVSTSTLSSFDDGISILTTDSPPQLIMKGLEDPE